MSYCKTCGTNCTLKGENITGTCNDYVQAAQPTGEPTVPGPYWVLFMSSGAKGIVNITERDILNKAFGITILNNNYVFKFSSCKFSGPIQPPEGWAE